MKSQFAGIILFSLILVFVYSFGYINPAISYGFEAPIGPENLTLTTPEYYVDGTNGDDVTGDGLSIGTAWASIGKAMTELSTTSGYTLYIATGTYNESLSVTSSGTSLVANTIRDYNGTVTINASGYDYGIYIEGKSYIDISNVSVLSSNYDGIKVVRNSDFDSVASITLDNLEVSSVGSSGDYSAISIAGTSHSKYPENITIKNCDLTGDYYGISVSTYCENISIGSNTITGCTSAGIYVSSSCDLGSIHYNEISLTTCTNGIKIINSCENWYVTNNEIVVSTSGIDGVYLDSVTAPILFNNFIVGNFSNSVVYDKDSVNFYMNYNSLRNLTTGNANAKGYYAERANPNPANSFHNNIVMLGDASCGHVIYIGGTEDNWKPSSASDITNNYFYNGLYCAYYGSNCDALSDWNSLIGAGYNASSEDDIDPLFASMTNLHLQSTSPCFAKATPITNITTDIENNTRNETHPCIGADELTVLIIPNTVSKSIDWSLEDIDVTVESGGALTLDGSSADIEMDFSTLSVSGTLNISGNVLLKATTFSVSGIVYLGDLGTEIRVNDLTVDSGAEINADGKGYAAASGPGCGDSSLTYGAGGGAYGGDGAAGGPGTSGGSADAYSGDYLFYYPNQNLGSGGGNGNSSIGGAGGGAINIEVYDTLELNGDITADGADGGNGGTGAGGGSGGGIYIYADKITGNGSISAKGGNGGTGASGTSGGGSGGRVATYNHDNQSFDKNNIDTSAGKNGDHNITAEAGTEESKSLPKNCKKGTCCDSNAAATTGTYGNETVNLVSGCLTTEYDLTYLQFNDGLSRNLELYYGSMNGILLESETSPSPVGSDGWTHSFNECLDLSDTANDEITYTMLCGAKVVFQDTNGDDTAYVAPPFYGDMPDIVYDGASSYTMTDKAGNVKTFNDSGQWTSYSDVMGNTMTLNYNEYNNKLDYVEYPDGRALNFEYDGSSKLSNVTCHEAVSGGTLAGAIEGTAVNFTYDGDRLESAGDWEFTYDGNGKLYEQKHISEATTPLKYRTTTFTYDAIDIGKCTKITDPESDSIEIEQDLLEHISTVKDLNGKIWIYGVDILKNVKTREIDPCGNEWIYVYDDKRRLIKTTPPANPYDSSTDSYTEYTYDSKGNVLTQKVVQKNTPTNYIYSQYAYDNYNNMTASWGPIANSMDISSGSNLDKTKIEYLYKVSNGTGSGTITSSGTLITGINTLFFTELVPGDTILVERSGLIQMRNVEVIADDYTLVVNESFYPDITMAIGYEINTNHEYFRKVREIKRRTGSSTYFVTHYEYDDLGKVTQVIENYGVGTTQRIIEYDYYATSNFVNSAISGFLEKTTVVVSGSPNLETSFRYDGAGRQIQVTSPNGTITQYLLNTKGQVVKSCTDIANEKLGADYIYNNIGDLISVKRGKWSTWNLGTEYVFADGVNDAFTYVSYVYNDKGRLHYTGNRLGQGSVYEYDKAGNTIKVMSGEIFTTIVGTTINTGTGYAYSQTEYEYYDNGSLKSTTTMLDDANDAVATYSYLPNGNIRYVTGPKYNDSTTMQTKYVYDYAGRIVDSLQKDNEVGPTYVGSHTNYDVFGRVSSVVDAESKETEYTYDDYTGRLTKSAIVKTGDDLETDYQYNDFGQISRVTYAAQGTNNQQIYKFNVYDSLGRITSSYAGDDAAETFTNGINRVVYLYDDYSRLESKVIHDIEDGSTTPVQYRYDSINRIIATCTANEGVVYTYDGLSNVANTKEVIFADFFSLMYATLRESRTIYDEANRMIKSVLNPIGEDRLESITTYYEYDELSRVKKVIDPKQWYANGRTATNAEHTEYVYDNASRLKAVNAHIGVGAGTEIKLAKYEYFNNGARKQMSYTQADNYDWVDVDYEYYPTGWLKSVEYPGYSNFDDKYNYEYYDTGVLKKVTHDDIVNDLYEYIYDDAWRLTEIKTGGITDKKFVYNDRSQITAIQNSTSTTEYAYAYDAFGRVTTTTDSTNNVFAAANKSINYTYTKAGLRKTMTTPDYEMQYHYDSLGRYTQIDRKVSGVYKKLAEYVYNELGQRMCYTRYDNTGTNVVVHTNYEYLMNIGWLQKVTNSEFPGGAEISSYQYYESIEGDKNDLVGNREYMKYSNGDSVEYEYDGLYRLSTETRRDNFGSQQAKYEFTYDQAGNRLSQSRYTTSATWEKYHTYEYNDANQLTYENQYDEDTMNVHLKGTQYVYNDLGNLIEKNIDTNPGDGLQYTDEYWDYAYDAYSRLIDIDKDSNNIADYTFNMLGNRVKKVTNTDTIKMLYDGYDCVADYDNSATPALLRYYITPGLDENLLVYDEETTDEEYFYVHDGLGTVRQIVDASQNVENQYDYEGFGTSLSSTESIYNRFRYTGRVIDTETNSANSTALYYYRARTYDSSAGSFTSRDPIPALNHYPYCHANPITHIDPNGLECVDLSLNEKEALKKLGNVMNDVKSNVQAIMNTLNSEIHMHWGAYVRRYRKYPIDPNGFLPGLDFGDFWDEMAMERARNNQDTEHADILSEFKHLGDFLQFRKLANWLIKKIDEAISNISSSSKEINNNSKCFKKCDDKSLKERCRCDALACVVKIEACGRKCKTMYFSNGWIDELLRGIKLNEKAATFAHELFHWNNDFDSSVEEESIANLISILFEGFSSAGFMSIYSNTDLLKPYRRNTNRTNIEQELYEILGFYTDDDKDRAEKSKKLINDIINPPRITNGGSDAIFF